MPIYFFEFDAEGLGWDQEGVDLPDEATARAFAEGLAETLQKSKWPEPPRTVLIRGSDGAKIARVPKVN